MITEENVWDEIKKLEPEYRDSICDVHGEYKEKGIFWFRAETKWLGCHLCKDEKNKAEEAKKLLIQQEDEQKKIESRLNQSGIPLRFRTRNFENYIADTKEKKHSLAVAKNYSENFKEIRKEGKNLIFSGKAGTGKSHLAIAIAQSLMPRYTALYINALDAVRMIRDTWRRDSEKSETQVLDMLGRIDLLIIDEVGVQYGTDNEQMLMFDIINRRYRDLKPIILLTNLGKAGFAEYLTERSFDRLRENGTWVSFDWESFRGKKVD